MNTQIQYCDQMSKLLAYAKGYLEDQIFHIPISLPFMIVKAQVTVEKRRSKKKIALFFPFLCLHHLVV